jgi:hypothetical protein
VLWDQMGLNPIIIHTYLKTLYIIVARVAQSVNTIRKLWPHFLGSERFFTSPTLRSCSVGPLSAGGLYSGAKQMGHEADSPPSSSVKIKHV